MEELLPKNGPGGAKDRRPDEADGPQDGPGRLDDRDGSSQGGVNGRGWVGDSDGRSQGGVDGRGQLDDRDGRSQGGIDGRGRLDDRDDGGGVDGRTKELAGSGDARLGRPGDSADALVRITIAGPDQAELIADLARRTFHDSFAGQNTAENMRIFQEEQFTREMQVAEVGAPGRTFFLAWIDDEPVGFASMRENPPPRALGAVSAIEIVQLYSEQKTIGKGVGKALMAACLELARQKGKEWVWLGVWEHNPRAIAFYQKWGFERFGEHIFLVGLDAQTDWWMKKRL